MFNSNLQNLVVKHAQQIVISLESAPEVILAFPGRHDVTMKTWVEYLCDKMLVEPPTNWQCRGNVYAQIVHSRWVVRCPYCPGNMLASKEDRRFWCLTCKMFHNNRQPANVLFPRRPDLIELVLVMRDLYINRNWRPGETMQQLAAENIAHGNTERQIYL